MTDTSRSQEIEDVLSSIRRLVADERPRPPARDAMRAAPACTGQGGPLLLTEALRVVSSTLHADAPEESFRTADVSGEPFGAPAEVAPEASPARDERDLRALFAVAARNVAQVNEPAPMAEWEEEDPDTVCDVTPLPFVTRRRAMPAAGFAPEAPPRDDGAESGMTAPETPPNRSTAGEASAPPEASVWRHGSTPDADLLRALVREILLEELSGALGERITRNLRRLARAEANRAVATRDLG